MLGLLKNFITKKVQVETKFFEKNWINFPKKHLRGGATVFKEFLGIYSILYLKISIIEPRIFRILVQKYRNWCIELGIFCFVFLFKKSEKFESLTGNSLGFFGILGSHSKKNPNPKNPKKSRDFWFGIFLGKKSQKSRDLGYGIWDPRKIPSQSHLC